MLIPFDFRSPPREAAAAGLSCSSQGLASVAPGSLAAGFVSHRAGMAAASDAFEHHLLLPLGL